MGPVFSRSEVLAVSGWTESALERAVRDRRLVRIRRNWYARPDLDLAIAQAHAAARACRGVISHRSAAHLHDLALLHSPAIPEITMPPNTCGRLSGARLIARRSARTSTSSSTARGNVHRSDASRSRARSMRRQPSSPWTALWSAALWMHASSQQRVPGSMRGLADRGLPRRWPSQARWPSRRSNHAVASSSRGIFRRRYFNRRS